MKIKCRPKVVEKFLCLLTSTVNKQRNTPRSQEISLYRNKNINRIKEGFSHRLKSKQKEGAFLYKYITFALYKR